MNAVKRVRDKYRIEVGISVPNPTGHVPSSSTEKRLGTKLVLYPARSLHFCYVVRDPFNRVCSLRDLQPLESSLVQTSLWLSWSKDHKQARRRHWNAVFRGSQIQSKYSHLPWIIGGVGRPYQTLPWPDI